MIDKNKKIIVLMPPKTASNSIRTLLEQFGYVFYQDSKIKSPQIHLKLSEIIKLYDVNNLNEYNIIQVVRNPYHRFISSFFFQKKIIPSGYSIKFKNFDLNEFTNHLLDSKRSNDFVSNFYGDTSFVNDCIQSGKSWGGTRFYDKQVDWNDVCVDVKYFKLEELSEETTQLQSYLNLPNEKLPKVNSQGLVLDYFELLTPDVKDIVVKLFKEDFEKFEYNK
jgi:virulence-associated protein VapD